MDIQRRFPWLYLGTMAGITLAILVLTYVFFAPSLLFLLLTGVAVFTVAVAIYGGRFLLAARHRREGSAGPGQRVNRGGPL